MEKLASFISTDKSTRNIAAGMVQVVDVYDYAFIGKWRYDQRRLLAESVADQTEQQSTDIHAPDDVTDDIRASINL